MRSSVPLDFRISFAVGLLNAPSPSESKMVAGRVASRLGSRHPRVEPCHIGPMSRACFFLSRACRLRSLDPRGLSPADEGATVSHPYERGRNRWSAGDSAPSAHTPARGRVQSASDAGKCWPPTVGPNTRREMPWGRTQRQQALRVCKAAALGPPISAGSDATSAGSCT